MNPTPEQLEDAYTAMIQAKLTTSSGIPVTDQELVDVFNGALDLAKTVSPTKGGVKTLYEN